MCGDSTKIEDVEKLMNGQKADMVFTSPPYNMGAGMYENYEDNLKSQEYIDFNLEVIHTWLPFLKGYLFWNISYNKNSRWEFLEIMYRIIKETGLRFLEMIVWDKGHALPITSKDMLTRQYEDVLFVGNEESINRDMDLFYVGTKYKRAFFNKKTNRGITNYWKVDTNNTQLENHLACFPVKLPAKAINLVTQPDELVVDMFLGSGSTLIACEQLGRTCYGMELDPKYVDVIRKRYAKLIGREEEWEKLSPKI
jgi:DNA modification methylase